MSPCEISRKKGALNLLTCDHKLFIGKLNTQINSQHPKNKLESHYDRVN